jgi:hypothetical protein
MFVAALSLSGLLLLSGCDQHPYPDAANSYVAPPKAPPPASLAGAPTSTPPAYAAPPVAYAPPPPRRYDSPTIVAMAPIPNPGEPGSENYYPNRIHDRRVHARLYASTPQGYGAAPAPWHSAARPGYDRVSKAPIYSHMATRSAPPTFATGPKSPVHAAAPSPAYARASAPPPAPKGYAGAFTPRGPVKPYTPPKDYRPAPPPAYAAAATKSAGSKAAGYAQKGAAVAASAATAVAVAGKDVAQTAKNATDQARATYNANKPAMAPPAPVSAPAATPVAAADRPTRLAALQSALTDATSKGAVLTAPQRFTANQPADVSLTIPATFADTVRTEAQKNGLSDAAASVNMNVVLSGDGFSVTPDETQSQPLIVGQPTEFRWTVTAQPGAKGPLHADVGADLLGGGSDTLALGSIQKQAGFGVKPTPRMVGAAILVLILALVVVWLARGRGPSRPASARRASRAARGARPLDMGTSTES